MKLEDFSLGTLYDMVRNLFDDMRDEMRTCASFEKVSFKQFFKDMQDTFGDSLVMGDNRSYSVNDPDFKHAVLTMYDEIKLPVRSTMEATGYDFFAPFSFVLLPGHTVKIPTGIRVQIDHGWGLKFYPRSGLGTKYRLQFDNTIPCIDGDYYHSDNEGHIFLKLTNDSKEEKTLTVVRGGAFAQGVFEIYGLARGDSVTTKRNGGFGSTDKK